MALNKIGREWQNVTIAADSVVRIFKGPIYVAPANTADDGAGYKIGTEFPAAAGSVLAFRGPGYIEIDAFPVPAGLPAQFATGGWSIAGGVDKLTVTVTTVPNLNGGTIVGIDYSVDGGPWVSLGRTTAGTADIEVAPETYSVRLAVRSDRGRGPASAAKSATATAA